MASLLTTAGRLALCKSATAWDTATHKAMLLRPTYVPDVAHGTVNLISSYEVSGTGYAGGYGGSGRKTVTSPRSPRTAPDGWCSTRLTSRGPRWTPESSGSWPSCARPVARTRPASSLPS